MKAALLAAALTIGGLSPACADAFDDSSDPPYPTTRHRVWVMRCNPDDGAPYYVGWDSADRTLQIKTPHGRPYTYHGVVSQISATTFRVVASRRDQARSLVVTFAGDASSLESIGLNSDGSNGGVDSCAVLGGRD